MNLERSTFFVNHMASSFFSYRFANPEIFIAAILAVVTSSVGAYAQRVSVPVHKRAETTYMIDANGNRARPAPRSEQTRDHTSRHGSNWQHDYVEVLMDQAGHIEKSAVTRRSIVINSHRKTPLSARGESTSLLILSRLQSPWRGGADLLGRIEGCRSLDRTRNRRSVYGCV